MVQKVTRWAVALFVLACVGVLGSSGCRIQLCKGSGCGGVPDVGGWGGAGGGAGGEYASGAAGTDDPFAGADPVAVNRESVRASAAMYLLEGTMEQTIEAQGIDPSTLDAETLKQIADTALPDVVAQVDEWMSQYVPESNDPQVPTQPAECYDMGCPPIVFCDSKFYDATVLCHNTACGDGKCKPCPDWFGSLKHMISSGWCSYVCMKGTSVVGSAGLVKSIFGDYQFCIVP